MEFYTDWMKPVLVNRHTGEAESFTGPRVGIKRRRFAQLPAPINGRSYAEVLVNDSIATVVCGEGVHKRFEVDARRVKRIRLIISDEPFEGSRTHRDTNHDHLHGLGAPPKLCVAQTVHWCVETEE